VAALLLSTVGAQDTDQQRRAPGSNGAAARRSAANAGRAMLTAELARLNANLSVGYREGRYSSSKSSLYLVHLHLMRLET